MKCRRFVDKSFIMPCYHGPNNKRRIRISFSERRVPIAIYLQAVSETSTKAAATSDDQLRLHRLLPNGRDAKSTFLIQENLWDCLGEILLGAVIWSRGMPEAAELCRIYVKGVPEFCPRYFTPESLLLFYLEMREKGWRIYMQSTNANPFCLECPDFGDPRLVPARISAAQRQSYAHPIDSGIIDLLDRPAIKTLFGSAVSMMTDMNYSQIISNGIPVNQESLPEVNELVEHCVAALGIRRPYVVLSGSIGMNAYTIGSDEEPYIVLGSILARIMTRERLLFIIGHECGHIAMGHVIYHTAVNMAGSLSAAIPVIGPMVYQTSALALSAWSRRSEITADRAGLLCCRDREAAQKALMQLNAGLIDLEKLDMQSYVGSSRRYRQGTVLRRIGELTQTHPPLTKRIEAIELFANSELYYQAAGLPSPASAISKTELSQSVERLIAVLGEE